MPMLGVHLGLHLVEIQRRYVVNSVSRSGLLYALDTLDGQTEDDLGALVGYRGQMDLSPQFLH